ncbi:MAG: branched-chain amino acid ABC transporter substrate-binding protein [Chloroflexi bacterium]|nr:MAG: branched-chain amino acid ABC transporter substrate-binding protein [Chloroflexota bacterium]
MKTLFRASILLALSLVMVLSVAPGLAQDDDPIVIGASLPLTGAFSTAGSKHQEGYQLCVDLVNERGGLLGRPVELIISDNGSDTEQALSQHERLINQDNVDLLFGTFSSRLTVPVSAIAEQNDMVYPIPAGGAIRIYERGFQNLFYFQQNAGEFVGASPINMLNELVGQDNPEYPRTAAVVGADDFFANAIADGLLGNEVVNPANGEVILDLAPGVLAENNIEVVFQETWPAEGFSDWLTLANNIKQSEAEMVMGLAASVDEIIQLTRAFETVDYNPKVIYYSQGTQSEFLEAVGPEAAEGVLIHAAWHPNVNFVGELLGEPFSNQDFLDAYAAAFDGALADEDVAIPFSLCQAMVQAVEAVGTTDNPTIREWLKSRTAEDPVRTILGQFHWDERGLPIGRSFIMAQWQDGELKFVFPLGEFEGTSDLIFPRP